jgi:CRP-like cAMP-binding protein
MKRQRSTPLKLETIEPQMCSVHTRYKVLSQVPFFRMLSAQDISEINKLFQEQGYRPGQPIYFAGDPAARLYIVAVGKVKLLRHTTSGQDVVLDILIPGEFFGTLSVLGQAEYPETAQAQTDCCILGIDAADFQTILRRHPPVTLTALEIIGQRLKAAHETIQQLSAYPVEKRIAFTLLKLADKVGQRQVEGLLLQIPLSRQDIAEMTGTTLETASRVMSQFQKDDLIRTGRQWVAITHYAELAALVKTE